MSAFFHAADDAHDILSGFRASLPTFAHVVEAVAIAVAASFVMVTLNVLF